MYRRNNLAYRIVDSFFRHKWIFLLSTLATIAVVLPTLLLRSQGYTATTALAVDQDKDLMGVANNGIAVNYNYNRANEHAQRFENLMRDDSSGGFIDRALDKAGLSQPIRVDPAANDKRLAELRKNLNPSTAGREVLLLRLNWPNKTECENILRAFQDAYIEHTGEIRQATSINTATFLDSQIKAYKKRMDEANQALQEYRSKNFGKLPAAQQGTIDRLSLLKQEQDYLNVTVGDVDQKTKFLEERRAFVSQRSNQNIVTDRKVARSPNYDKLLALRNERASYMARDYKIDSEAVRAINNQILEYNKILLQEAATNPPGVEAGQRVESQTLTANPEIFSLGQQIAEAKIVAETQRERMKLLGKEIAKYENTIKELPKAERELADKTQDADIIRKQMSDMQAQREKVRLKASIDKLTAISSMQPLGRVNAVSTTGTTKILSMIAGSILIGLIAGVIVVVGREWLDPAIRYEPDVERALGVPVLAGLLDSREVLALPEGDGKRTSRPVLPMPPTESAA